MPLPDDFNTNGVLKIKPISETETLVAYGDGKPPVTVHATPSEVDRAITEAKGRADSDPDHT